MHLIRVPADTFNTFGLGDIFKESNDLDHLVVPEDRVGKHCSDERTQNINTQAKKKERNNKNICINSAFLFVFKH